MTMTAAPSATYRKTKSGEWVVFAPLSAFEASGWITVTKRDGTIKNEIIERTGRPFDVGGVTMAYGYIDRETKRTYAVTRSADRCRGCRCHTEARAGQPGTILYDGCDRCGCEAA